MLLFEFYHDVDLELNWISEHVPGSGSTAYDKSLAGAISLMQKHKVQSELLPSICLCKELSINIKNVICCTVYHMHQKIYKYAVNAVVKSCLFPHPRPLCVYVGVAGRNYCSPKTSEPGPGKGAGPGQIQQNRRRGSAAEVPPVVLFQGYCTLFLHLMVE